MSIPSNIITDLMNSTVTVINGFLPFVILFFSMAITFYVIKHVINFLPKT